MIGATCDAGRDNAGKERRTEAEADISRSRASMFAEVVGSRWIARGLCGEVSPLVSSSVVGGEARQNVMPTRLGLARLKRWQTE